METPFTGPSEAFFLWKIAVEALPVRVPSFRPIVGAFFVECSFARLLWQQSPWPINISRVPISSPAHWLKLLLSADSWLDISASSVPSFILNAALVMDVLWYNSNQIVHDGVTVMLADLRASLIRRYSAHSSTWHSRCPRFAPTCMGSS